MKLLSILFGSIFLIRADVKNEYVGYYKGFKLDLSDYNDKTLEEVKNGLKKTNEYINIESTSTNEITREEDGKQIKVNVINLIISEKSDPVFEDCHCFKDELSKYLKKEISKSLSYNDILDILAKYEENGESKSIKFGNKTNGLVKIIIYNGDKITDIHESNKNTKLNFTKIKFVFTQDLYKKCQISVNIDHEDNEYNVYNKEYNSRIGNKDKYVNNGLSLYELFDIISKKQLEIYEDGDFKIDRSDKKILDNEAIFSYYIRSFYNLNAVKIFNYITEIIFEDNNGSKHVIYQRGNGNNDLFTILKNEKVKYNYAGKYIIKTDYSPYDFKNIRYIRIKLYKDGKVYYSGLSVKKNIRVSDFKEFLKACKIIEEGDNVEFFKKKDGNDCCTLKDDNNFDDDNSITFDCIVKYPEGVDLKSRKFFGDISLDDCLKFEKDFEGNNTKCCRCKKNRN